MDRLWIDLALTTPVLAALLPVSVLAYQISGSSSRFSDAMAGSSDSLPTAAPPFAVLIPAHNEALVIEATLQNVQAQLRASDRVVVVADNCSDETAALARSLGAEVAERHDPDRRGKGYALAHGVQHLASSDPPSVVIVVDADCLVTPNALVRLAEHAARTHRPVQALYLMNPAQDAGTAQRVSVFAWRVKNWLRPSGATARGWPCMLTGSGMAFPWDLLAQSDLAHAGMVEDMQLGIDLTHRGAAPVFLESALVTSSLAATKRARATQRSRWEGGHLAQIALQGPGLLVRAIAPRGAMAGRLLLDLLVPPLALLALYTGVVLVGTMLLASLRVASVLPAVVAAATALLLVLCVVKAWRRCGRDLIAPAQMPALVWYAIQKIPHYAGLLFKRRLGWVKTSREQ